MVYRNKMHKQNVTEKLFYGKYPFRITIALDDIVVQNWHNYLNQNNVDYKTVKSWGSDHVRRYYLADKNVLNWLNTQTSIELRELSAPINAAQLELIQKDDKIRIRSSLFFDKFRISIKFKRYGWNQDDRQWLDKRFESAEEPDHKWLHLWNPCLYLNSMDLLSLIKLTFSEQIDRIIIIKLPNEF